MEDPAAKIISVLLSLLLSVGSVVIAIVLIHHSNQSENKSESPQTYFIGTSEATAICNILCCLSVSIYCIWIIFDDTHNLEWFIALRAATTVCWFASKVALIWLFNGRLYYAFINSPLELPRARFIAMNVVITIVSPLCIILGYVGVWNGLPWMIVLGFQGFRFIYLFNSTLLLCMFSKRLLSLQRLVIQNTEKEIKPATNVQQQNLLDVATRNAVLTLLISLSALFVVASWLLHDFAFIQSHLTLLLPFLMFAIDSVLNSCCVFLLFMFEEDLYAKVCRKCDRCCRRLYIHTELRLFAANIDPQLWDPPRLSSEKKASEVSTPNMSGNASTAESYQVTIS